MAAVGQTVAGTAHYMKNLLTGLMAGAELVDGGGQAGGRGRFLAAAAAADGAAASRAAGRAVLSNDLISAERDDEASAADSTPRSLQQRGRARAP